MNTSTVNLSLPRKLLSRADRIASSESRSRSELVRTAVLNYVERRERWNELLALARRQARKRKITPADVEAEIQKYRRGA